MNIHIRTRFQKENKNRGQGFSNGRRAAKSQLDKREVSPTSGLGQQVRTKKSTRLVTILQKRVLFFVRAWPTANHDNCFRLLDKSDNRLQAERNAQIHVPKKLRRRRGDVCKDASFGLLSFVCKSFSPPPSRPTWGGETSRLALP